MGRSFLTRREFGRAVGATAGAVALAGLTPVKAEQGFRLRYIVASPMYGEMPLSAIVPQVPEAGAEHLDIWPRPHGNQREQLDEMGVTAFRELLAEHDVKLGAITRYDLFPFDIGDEMELAADLGASVMVGSVFENQHLEGEARREAVVDFAARMGELGRLAGELGLTLAIENHSNGLIHDADTMRWFADAAPPHVGIAFAPHHLPQDADLQAKLIEDLGDKVAFFYAQQHGTGSSEEQPREKELLQMPGRGPLEFQPLVAALRKIDFRGFTEIFMHPYPRGIPIADTAEQVTAEINRSREYLDRCAAG